MCFFYSNKLTSYISIVCIRILLARCQGNISPDFVDISTAIMILVGTMKLYTYVLKLRQKRQHGGEHVTLSQRHFVSCDESVVTNLLAKS